MDCVTGSPVLLERGNFILKIADDAAEVEQALRLRFRVFNQEQGRLSGISGLGVDEDKFDSQCMHLVVIDREANAVVGTYRVHRGDVALRHGGFYSEQEYEISGLPEIAGRTLELGRSCVAPEYRSGSVVAMLWSGIAELRHRFGGQYQYLLGCVSLETTDRLIGHTLYIRAKNYLTDQIWAVSRPGFQLDAVPAADVRDFLENRRAELLAAMPPLFKGYIRLGARFCSEPAYDREFGSIDYLILADYDKISARYARHFME